MREIRNTVDGYIVQAILAIKHHECWKSFLHRKYITGMGIVWLTYPSSVVIVCETLFFKAGRFDWQGILTAKLVGTLCTHEWKFRRAHTRDGNAIILDDDILEGLRTDYQLEVCDG